MFAGTIFDLVDPIYLTAHTNFIGGSGKPFGERHSFYELIMTVGAGVRF